MSDLGSWTAAELGAAIASGRISSVEATESALARMEAVNPTLNAVVDPLPEQAMADARAADAALRRGGPKGPLHGVPVTVKINVDYAGRATTNGVTAFRDLIPSEDGSVVRNLRAGGAVIIGRTNAPSFSMRWSTENDLHGTTLNPHHPDLTAGGSSGGAGSATAAGIGAMGHGNDIAGSVRHPAYCNGIWGLRPTSGLLPMYNPSQLSERFIASQMAAVQGPHARSAADIAIALQVMSAPDARDIWQVPLPPQSPLPGPCRVVLVTEAEGCTPDATVVAAIEEAGRMLSDAGYEIVQRKAPSIDEAADLWRLVIGNEMRAGLFPLMLDKGDAMVQRTMGQMLTGVPELDRDGFLKAFARRSTLLREWQLFFEDVPLILTAVNWIEPFRRGMDQADDFDFETFWRKVTPTVPAPILGLPGLTVPVGTVPGKPMGVQLMAKRFGEPILMAAAFALERALGGPVAPVDKVSPGAGQP